MMNNDKYTYNFLYSIVEEVMDDLDLETDKYTVDKNVKWVISDENLYTEIYSSILESIKDNNNIE